MTLNLTPLPTSAGELDEQIDAAFKPDEAKPEAKAKPEKNSAADYEAEYIPPDTDREDAYAETLRETVNPYLDAIGVRKLSDRDIQKNAGAAADVVANLNGPKFLEQMSPLKLSLLTAAYVVTLTALPRVVELITKAPTIRNVTPQAAPEKADPEPRQGEPLYE